jgi:hypothetical protein
MNQMLQGGLTCFMAAFETFWVPRMSKQNNSKMFWGNHHPKQQIQFFLGGLMGIACISRSLSCEKLGKLQGKIFAIEHEMPVIFMFNVAVSSGAADRRPGGHSFQSFSAFFPSMLRSCTGPKLIIRHDERKLDKFTN